MFHGYLQTEVNPRRARLRELEATSKRLQQTQVFIETPYRNAVMLEAALEVLQPTTRLAISCGLTLPDGWSLCKTAARVEGREDRAAGSRAGGVQPARLTRLLAERRRHDGAVRHQHHGGARASLASARSPNQSPTT